MSAKQMLAVIGASLAIAGGIAVGSVRGDGSGTTPDEASAAPVELRAEGRAAAPLVPGPVADALLAEARRILSAARDGGAAGEIGRMVIFDCPACESGMGLEVFDELGHASAELRPGLLDALDAGAAE